MPVHASSLASPLQLFRDGILRSLSLSDLDDSSSGFAMVLIDDYPETLHLEDYITIEHIESMNKVILLTGNCGCCIFNGVIYLLIIQDMCMSSLHFQ